MRYCTECGELKGDEEFDFRCASWICHPCVLELARQARHRQRDEEQQKREQKEERQLVQQMAQAVSNGEVPRMLDIAREFSRRVGGLSKCVNRYMAIVEKAEATDSLYLAERGLKGILNYWTEVEKHQDAKDIATNRLSDNDLARALAMKLSERSGISPEVAMQIVIEQTGMQSSEMIPNDRLSYTAT